MDYHLQWLIDEQVIFLYAGGDVNAGDIKQLLDEYQALLEMSQYKPHSIILLGKLGHLQVSVKDLASLLQSKFPARQQAGWALLHGEIGSVGRMLSEIAFQITGVKHRWLNSYEDCLAFLLDMDASLHDLPLNPISKTSTKGE